ncbi:hypothetical protein MASR2M78_31590 [Treponema sp.]
MRGICTAPLAVRRNRLERLGRNAIFMQSKLMESLAFKEDLVADGFESFTKSQYHPCNINILVGKKSQFLYEATYTTLRRKGRMTEQQKKKRELIEAKYRPKARCAQEVVLATLRPDQ